MESALRRTAQGESLKINGGSMFWLKWISIIAIYLLVYVFSQIFSFGNYFFPCLLTSAVVFFLVFYVSRKRFLQQLTLETLQSDEAVPHDARVAVVFVVKNEGERFVKNVRDYLSLTGPIQVYVYDDHSDDQTVEKLYALQCETDPLTGVDYRDRLHIRSVPVSEKRMHPKGIALEEAFHTIDCDLFFVGDADTAISGETFGKALNYLIRERYDVLHLTRRNIEQDTLSYSIADSDEIFVSGLHTLNVIPFNFTGSSFFISSKIAGKINFPSQVYSEDSEIGRQACVYARKKGFSISCHTWERAPQTLFLLLKQRWNWNKYAMNQYFEQNFPVIILAVLLSANLMFGLLSIYSFNFLCTLIGLFCALAFSLSTNLYIASKKFSEAFISSCAYVLVILLQFGILYFIQILFLLKDQHAGVRYCKTESLAK